MSDSSIPASDLVKTEVDAQIFTELERLNPPARARIEALRDLCAEPVDSRGKLKRLRIAIKALQKRSKLTSAESGYFREVREQLTEIADDLKFASTKRGGFVIMAQGWAETLRQAKEKDARFDRVMVGIHGKKSCLIAVGEVVDAAVLGAFKALVEAHEPPAEMLYNVRIEAAPGGGDRGEGREEDPQEDLEEGLAG